MALTHADVLRAERRSAERLRDQPHATAARYDAEEGRILVRLSNGLDLGVPVDRAEGLAGADAADLAEIQITPTGLGLHWPRLDADLYLPALIEGIFGSRRWMAQVMGRAGGEANTPAKQAAARENGNRGGRPRKVTPA